MLTNEILEEIYQYREAQALISKTCVLPSDQSGKPSVNLPPKQPVERLK